MVGAIVRPLRNDGDLPIIIEITLRAQRSVPILFDPPQRKQTPHAEVSFMHRESAVITGCNLAPLFPRQKSFPHIRQNDGCRADRTSILLICLRGPRICCGVEQKECDV